MRMTDGLDMTYDLRCPICLYPQVSRDAMIKHLVRCAHNESFKMCRKPGYRPPGMRRDINDLPPG
jgi:hypothetical protein